jgi:hypothetical protein
MPWPNLPQPNTFPDFESTFHIKRRNHGIKVCSFPPHPHPHSLGMKSILTLVHSLSGRGGWHRHARMGFNKFCPLEFPPPCAPEHGADDIL